MCLSPMEGRRLRIGALALLLAVGPDAAWAARPLATEDTGTVEPGKGELELSGDYAKSSGDQLWFVKGVLSIGLLPRLEARIESAALLLEPQNCSAL